MIELTCQVNQAEAILSIQSRTRDWDDGTGDSWAERFEHQRRPASHRPRHAKRSGSRSVRLGQTATSASWSVR